MSGGRIVCEAMLNKPALAVEIFFGGAEALSTSIGTFGALDAGGSDVWIPSSVFKDVVFNITFSHRTHWNRLIFWTVAGRISAPHCPHCFGVC